MYNVDSSLRISIQYQNPRFHINALPYRIDSSNVQFCETVYITLLNFKPYKSCEGCLQNNDSQYTALTSVSNFSVTILSFKDRVKEGRFEGDFNNQSTAMFKVTNGYFRTRLEKDNIRKTAPNTGIRQYELLKSLYLSIFNHQ